MTPRETSQKLSPREFLQLCGLVDNICDRRGAKFDVQEVVRNSEEVIIAIDVDTLAKDQVCRFNVTVKAEPLVVTHDPQVIALRSA